MQIEHEIWKPTRKDGLKGQRVAVIGYSHYVEGEDDHVGLTREVLQGVVDGTRSHGFYTSVRNAFGYDSHSEFWSRVYFFNFLPDSVGKNDQKHQVGTKLQHENGRLRFLRFLKEEKPDKVFIFSTKGWKAFPEETLEEQNGSACNRLFPEKAEPTWGTYIVGTHRVLACGFVHPERAPKEQQFKEVQAFLDLVPSRHGEPENSPLR